MAAPRPRAKLEGATIARQVFARAVRGKGKNDDGRVTLAVTEDELGAIAAIAWELGCNAAMKAAIGGDDEDE